MGLAGAGTSEVKVVEVEVEVDVESVSESNILSKLLIFGRALALALTGASALASLACGLARGGSGDLARAAGSGDLFF